MKAASRIASFLRLGATAACAVGFAVFATGGDAQAQCLTPPGDLNDDGKTNVLDLQCGIFVSLFDSGAPGITELPACLKAPEQAADINCDGSVTVSDVLITVNYAVNLPLAGAIDADGDACPDACEVPDTFGALPAIASGTSASPSFTLRATSTGFQATGTSSSSSFSLKPKTVKSAD